MNEMARTFLAELEQSHDETRKVTTTLLGTALECVERWRGGRSVKDTVAAMVQIADRVLTEEQQAASRASKPVETSNPK